MKKINIKSSAIFRIIVLLLLFTTVSTYLVFNMYAKYTSSSDNGSPDASVSDWGFTLSIDGSKMFSEYYSGGVRADAELGDYEYGVRAQAGSTVITPDTSGFIKISLTGSSNVKSRISFAADGSDVKLTHAGGTYQPIKWHYTITKKGVEITSESDLTFEQLFTRINSASVDIAANDGDAIVCEIGWEWPLESGAPAQVEQNNLYDTIIAVHAADPDISDGYTVNARIELDIIATIEQVQ